MKNFLKVHWPLLIIIFIALFFRFWRPFDFQFWSTDEEIIAHFARKIADENRVFLISPNFSLGISLGSAFYMVSGLLYKITSLNPNYVFLITSFLGVFTTILLYWIGYMIRGRTFGIIASLLYAASFLTSLNDRRWWTLTVAPFFTTLAIFSLLQILRKKYLYFTILALCIATAWQIDPNLGIISLMALIVFFLKKIPLLHRQFIPGYLIIVLSIAPLLFFELRHPGTVIQPLLTKITSFQSTQIGNNTIGKFPLFLSKIPQEYGSYLAIAPDKNMDAVFNWLKTPQIVFSPIPQFIAAMFLILTLIWLWKNKRFQNYSREAIKFLWIFLTISLLALSFSQIIFGLQSRTYYFHVTIPFIFLLLGYGVFLVYEKKKYVAVGLLIIFTVVNLQTLLQSDFRYPLKDKQKVVSESIKQLNNQQFALHTVNGPDFANNGFTGLFVLQKNPPVTSDEYDVLDWWFRAHSLYFTNPDNKQFTKTIFISTAPQGFPENQISFIDQIENMQVVILNAQPNETQAY